MTKFSLWIAFFFAFFASIFSTIFFPSFRFFYFAPFLAIVFQKKSLQKSIWIAGLSGLILDLLGSATPLGAFSLIFVLCTLVCYRFKHVFFEERLLSLPLFTSLISSTFSLFHIFLFPSMFSIKALLYTVFMLPIFDGIYAFFWFTCPFTLFRRIAK